MPELVHLAIPAFLILLVVEAILSAVRAHREAREGATPTARGYAPRDTAASLAMGVGNVVVNLATKGAVFAVFHAVYEHRLFEPGAGPWVLVAAILGEDLLYYWNHRAGHEVRLFWAAHVTHHSSRHYNLSTALRQTWTGWPQRILFYWPLPLLGIDPMLLLTASSVSLIYQFWIHTEHVGRLPRWFESVFNTPSHHRVHHGTNVEYLDRNHAGILILWDRLFGTFEPERARPTYGLTTNLESHNPITIAFHEWAALARDLRHARTWRERLGYVFGPPGWSPDGSRRTARELRAALGAGAQAA